MGNLQVINHKLPIMKLVQCLMLRESEDRLTRSTKMIGSVLNVPLWMRIPKRVLPDGKLRESIVSNRDKTGKTKNKQTANFLLTIRLAVSNLDVFPTVAKLMSIHHLDMKTFMTDTQAILWGQSLFGKAFLVIVVQGQFLNIPQQTQSHQTER